MRGGDVAAMAIAAAFLVHLAGHLFEEPRYRLTGFNCGPERLTFVAMEEDHFPQCERIEKLKH